jgi:hypothetical protein
VDTPVDRPVDKYVQYVPVDKSLLGPQFIHSLCTILHTPYPQTQFDPIAGLNAHFHISTGPITTTTILIESLKAVEI